MTRTMAAISGFLMAVTYINALAFQGNQPLRLFPGVEQFASTRSNMDPEIAVGPNHIVIVYNHGFQVYSRDGIRLLEDTPFSDLHPDATSGALDPEIVYDPQSDEFVLVFMEPGIRKLFYGILGSDPTNSANWSFYSRTLGFRSRIDQPNLTVHDDILLVWTVGLASGPNGSIPIATIINKTELLSRPLQPPAAIELPLSDMALTPWTLRSGPSIMPGGSSFLTSARVIQEEANDPATGIRLYAMLDPIDVFQDSTKEFSIVADIDIDDVRFVSRVDAKGGQASIIAGEFRSAHDLIGDTLWLVHSVVRPGTADRTIGRWYQISLNGWPVDGASVPCVVRSGDLDLPSEIEDETASVFTPSIAVNKYGTAVVSFYVAGANTRVHLYSAVKRPSDTEFSDILPIAVSTGEGSFAIDYSRIVVDPANPHVFWAHCGFLEFDSDQSDSFRSTRVFAVAPEYCPADLTGSSSPSDPMYGLPDGAVDSDDLFYFLDMFAQGNLEVDLASSQGGTVVGVPDFLLTSADSDYFFEIFEQPCEERVSTDCSP